MSGKRRQAALTAAALVVIALVFAVTWFLDRDSGESADASSATSVSATKSAKKSAGTTATKSPRSTQTKSPRTTATDGPATGAVPARVRKTLALIDSGEWPEAANAPGTRGGMTFRNNERRLPATDSAGNRITYREWDVNPKKPGQGRDAERIVTGSDGTAYYTSDHYSTFIRIRGPA